VCVCAQKGKKRDLMMAITVKKVRIGTGSKIKSKRHRREGTRERERERAVLSLRKGQREQRGKKGKETTANES